VPVNPRDCLDRPVGRHRVLARESNGLTLSGQSIASLPDKSSRHEMSRRLAWKCSSWANFTVRPGAAQIEAAERGA
jgi:hypothetical protein